MALGVAVVFDVAGFRGVDGVVAAHAAVVAGEPVRAPLPEDDVAGYHVLLAGFLGPEPFAGAVFGAVGAALGCVRGVAALGAREEGWGRSCGRGRCGWEEEVGGQREGWGCGGGGDGCEEGAEEGP